MTVSFSTRRRADEFDAALARPLTERDAERFADLLTLVRDLRSIPAPTPRPEFVASLRSQLMTEAETALLPQSVRPLTAEEQRLVLPVRRARDRRLATVLGGAALVGATASMAVAAQTALPGESLYTVKLALEDAETGIARSDTARGEALLANARGRLDEIDALAARGTPRSLSAVESTLESFSDQADEASQVLLAAYAQTGDQAVITGLRSFASTSMDRLSALQPALPAATQDELVAAGERLADIDRRAREACASCGGAPASVPPNLAVRTDTSSGVGTVIVAASQDPALLEPVRSGPRPSTPPVPEPLSGQDVTGVEVPDLQLPGATQAPSPTQSSPSGDKQQPGLPGPKVVVKTDVSDVTKLLTGDLTPAADDLPGIDDPVDGVAPPTVDGTLGGTLGGAAEGLEGLEGTLDGSTGTVVP